MSSPLHSLHEQAGAEFQDYGGIAIVQTFGHPQAEYAALHKSAGLMDMPHRGLVELSGRDRLEFLNNLLTNQTYDKQAKRPLAAGSGIYAFLLNAKGRIVTDLSVLELGERTILELEKRMVQPLIQIIDRYLFSEQVKVADRSQTLCEFVLAGPEARQVLARHATHPLPDLAPLASCVLDIAGRQVVVYRDDICAAEAYGLIVESGAAEELWRCLAGTHLARGAESAVSHVPRPVGWAAFNACRIERGRPLFGIDFDETVLPAETGQLGRAVSFTKGCYLGQEIVARMHSRGQVARRIAAIRMRGEALPVAGSKVYDHEGNEVGVVTSSTISPVLSNTALVLAMLKRPFFEPGTELVLPAEGAMHPGTVVVPPFLP